jgi:hypothetical protein
LRIFAHEPPLADFCNKICHVQTLERVKVAA